MINPLKSSQNFTQASSCGNDSETHQGESCFQEAFVNFDPKFMNEDEENAHQRQDHLLLKDDLPSKDVFSALKNHDVNLSTSPPSDNFACGQDFGAEDFFSNDANISSGQILEAGSRKVDIITNTKKLDVSLDTKTSNLSIRPKALSSETLPVNLDGCDLHLSNPEGFYQPSSQLSLLGAIESHSDFNVSSPGGNTALQLGAVSSADSARFGSLLAFDSAQNTPRHDSPLDEFDPITTNLDLINSPNLGVKKLYFGDELFAKQSVSSPENVLQIFNGIKEPSIKGKLKNSTLMINHGEPGDGLHSTKESNRWKIAVELFLPDHVLSQDLVDQRFQSTERSFSSWAAIYTPQSLSRLDTSLSTGEMKLDHTTKAEGLVTNVIETRVSQSVDKKSDQLLPLQTGNDVKLDLSSTNWRSMFNSHIINGALKNLSQIKFILSPQRLGKIVVHLKVDVNDVSVALQSSNGNVAGMLQNAEGKLDTLLSDHGMKLASFSVNSEQHRNEKRNKEHVHKETSVDVNHDEASVQMTQDVRIDKRLRGHTGDYDYVV